MGWLFMTREGMGGHATAKAYLDARLTYPPREEGGSGLRVLASSCLRNKVYYAAVQPYGGSDTAVFAMICQEVGIHLMLRELRGDVEALCQINGSNIQRTLANDAAPEQ